MPLIFRPGIFDAKEPTEIMI